MVEEGDAAFEARLKTVFEQFDDDGSGEIDVEELGMVMDSLGQRCTMAELHDMVNEVDTDGNGTIEFDEFMEMMVSVKNSEIGFEDDIIKAFAKFDTDGSGYLDEKQLAEVSTNLGEMLGEEELEAVIDCCKEKGFVDEEGRINYAAFVKAELGDKATD